MKNRKFVIFVGLICLALLLAMLPLGSACAPAEAKTLKIGITTPSTGKAAEKGAPGGH